MSSYNERIDIIVDTNVWGDLRNLFKSFRDISQWSYEQLWRLSDEERDFLVKDFKGRKEIDQREKFNKVIKIYDRFREMISSTETRYVIHVPKFVFNEVREGVTSKMIEDEEKKEVFDQDEIAGGFDELMFSLPLEKEIDPTILQEGKDFPEKIDKSKNVEEAMEVFLNKINDAKIDDLKKHLQNADRNQKRTVKERTEDLKKRMHVIDLKNKRWDQHMLKTSKVHNYHYETRTMALNKMASKIRQYENPEKIVFENPLNVLSKRLTTFSEEFDFFDLQIYLHAKEHDAVVLTQNNQAFQEINDPRFLGYFQDIQIVNPVVNFDSLEDLQNSGDLREIIDKSILDDLWKVDLPVCRELDSRLDTAVLENSARDLIDEVGSSYSPAEKKLEIKIPLGAVLKALSFENNELKVSKDFISGEPNKGKFLILEHIHENYFNNELNSNNFERGDIHNEALKEKILQNDGLAKHLERNKNIKENLIAFQENPGTGLDIFLENYRGKTYPEVIDLFNAVVIENDFSESDILKALSASPHEPALSLGECPASGRLRKRQTAECSLEWEQIDQISAERIEERDPQRVIIDSEKFLDHLKTIQDPKQRKQLIEFADQVMNLAEDHRSKIIGPKVAEVTHLINNRKVLNHFSKVQHVGSALNYGFFAKSLLADMLNGDIEGVAFNLGFMAGGEAFARISAVSLTKGLEYAEAGRMLLGNSMKFASPFIGRVLSPLIVLDLYHQIKALGEGDKDAIVGIIGDSVFLIIDAVDIGVSLLEIAGLIAEVSSVTGPIGMVVGALVMVATDIYMAVRKVDNVDRIIHLTTGERWEMYATTFFTFGLVKMDVERLVPIKDANNKLAQQALEALKKSNDIQRIVVPSAELRGEDHIEVADNNWFTTDFAGSNIKWNRVRPDDPEGGRIFCAPEGDWENPPSWIMARCGSAIGVADLAPKTQNYTLFSLGNGEDYIQGFKDSPNIFRIGKGKKEMRGGDKNDVFILEEGTTFDDFPEGLVDGIAGGDILDLRGMNGEDSEAVAIFFQEEPVEARVTQIRDVTSFSSYQPNFNFFNIDSIIGRENKVDFIYTNCSTKYVDGRGGRPDFADQIHVPHTYKECNHDKAIQLGPNTMLINEAVTGNFSYFVTDVHTSDIRCTLKRSLPNKTLVKDPETNRIEHKFFVNGAFSDIIKFEFHHDKNDYNDIDIRIYFKDKNGKITRFHLNTILGYGKNNGGMDNIAIYMNDNVELRYHHHGIYALLKSNKPVPDIIKKYQPIAIDFGISIFVYSEKEGAIVSIGCDGKDHVLHNDPSYKTYLVGNKGDNAYVIVSGEDVLDGPDPPAIPDVVIYSSTDQDHINTLNLHAVSQQIKQDLGQKLLMKHIFDSEKLVIHLYTFDNSTDDNSTNILNPYNEVTTVTFKNLVAGENWDSWCKRLHVILNNAPVLLKCDQDYKNKFGYDILFEDDVYYYNPSNYYTPLPLVFSDHEIIVITEDDIEPHTDVIVGQNLGQHRYLRHDDDLILTNGFDIKTPAYRPTTVMIKNFYKDREFFLKLKFIFNDKTMNLSQELDDILAAKDLEDRYKEYHDVSKAITGDLPRRSKRDLGEETLLRKRFSESQPTQPPSLATGFIGTVFRSISEVCHKSLSYFNEYFKSPKRPITTHVLNEKQNPNIDSINGHGTVGERLLDSQTNIPVSNGNGITYTNLNSTLLLLDTLVRKLSDSKYKQPMEEDLLPPQEQIQMKMVELSKKLGLDYNDIAGSLEKQHQRILGSIREE